MSKIQIRFKSCIKDLVIPDTTIFVPTDLKKSGLSQLLSHILGNDQEESFEFLIDKKVLSGTLSSFILKNSISTENILELQVLRSFNKPELENSVQHPDWISSIKFNKNKILTSCYDGNLRIFNLNGNGVPKLEKEISGFNGFIKTACYTSGGIVAGGQFGNIRYVSNDGKLTLESTYHKDTVTSLVVRDEFFISSSFDTKVSLWKIEGAAEEDTKSSKKKRKTENVVQSFSAPLDFDGHTGPVSGLVWSSKDEIYSVSLDHSFRKWDVESRSCIQILNSDSPFLSVSQQNEMFATSHADSILRFWDNQSNISVHRINTREHWNTCVEWLNNYEIACVGQNMMSVWDVRASNKPLMKIPLESKVLAMAWSSDKFALGGESGMLQVYNRK